MSSSEILSLHLYMPREDQDAFLKEHYDFVLERKSYLFDSFWFIRYSDENGTHLRIRYLPVEHPQKVRKVLDDELNKSYGRQLAGAWSYEWRPFEPEYERYGGPEGFKYAQQIFTFSSADALPDDGLLEETESEEQAILTNWISVIAPLLTTSGIPNKILGQLLFNYGEAWIKVAMEPDRVAEVLEEVNGDGTLLLSEDIWSEAMDIQSWDENDIESDYPIVLACNYLKEEIMEGELPARSAEHRATWINGLVEGKQEEWILYLFDFVHLHSNRVGFNNITEGILYCLMGKSILNIPD